MRRSTELSYLQKPSNFPPPPIILAFHTDGIELDLDVTEGLPLYGVVWLSFPMYEIELHKQYLSMVFPILKSIYRFCSSSIGVDFPGGGPWRREDVILNYYPLLTGNPMTFIGLISGLRMFAN